MNSIEVEETSFSNAMVRRLVDEFAVSYFNGSIKPNLAERNPATGRDIEYLMDSPQFEKTNKSDIWSYSKAVGTGYEFRVTYRDKRFSDLDQFLGMYTAGTILSGDDRVKVERKLYEMILVLAREGRLPPSFKIQSARDNRLDKLAASVDQLSQSLEVLKESVRKLEERLDGRNPTSVVSGPVSEQAPAS